MKKNSNNPILDQVISVDDYRPEINVPHQGSLQERLAIMSQELERKRAEELHRREQERLRPFREKVASLESLKKQLETIYESILPKQGKSKQEILDDALFRKQQQEDLLKILVVDNAEVLGLSGIYSIEQIINHADFSTTPEVVTYHAIHNELEKIAEQQKVLIQELKKHGVTLSENDFTYETALQAISMRLQEVTKELVTEKQNTPEGREEVLGNIQKLFISELPKVQAETYFSSLPDEKKISFELIGINGNRSEIFVHNDLSVQFDNSLDVSIVPVSYFEIEKNFSDIVAQKSLRESFQELLDQSLGTAGDIEDTFKKQVITKVVKILEQAFVLQEAYKKLAKISPDGNPDYYVDHKKESDRTKQEIREIRKNLDQIEKEVDPNEIIFLTKTSFRFPGRTELYNQAVNDTELVERSLAEIVKTLQRIEQNEPFFGKQIWENNIATLKAKKAQLEKEIRDLKEKQRQTYAGSEEYLKFQNHYSELKKFLEQEKFAQPEEGVFADLKSILNNRINQFEQEYVVSTDIADYLKTAYQEYESEKEILNSLLQAK